MRKSLTALNSSASVISCVSVLLHTSVCREVPSLYQSTFSDTYSQSLYCRLLSQYCTEFGAARIIGKEGKEGGRILSREERAGHGSCGCPHTLPPALHLPLHLGELLALVLGGGTF